jgi:hypothetical protein
MDDSRNNNKSNINNSRRFGGVVAAIIDQYKGKNFVRCGK